MFLVTHTFPLTSSHISLNLYKLWDIPHICLISTCTRALRKVPQSTVNQIQPLILDKGMTKYVACMVNPVKGSKITLCQDYGSLNRVRAPSEPLNSMIFPWLFHDKEIPWPFSTQPCTQKGSARISFFVVYFNFSWLFHDFIHFFKDFHDFSRPGSQSFTFHDFSRFSMTAWSLFKVSFFFFLYISTSLFSYTNFHEQYCKTGEHGKIEILHC